MSRSTTQTQPQTEHPHCYVVEDYRDAWGAMLPGMLALHASNPLQDWSVESIREMLDADLAAVLLDAQEPSAFAIVQLDDSPYHPGERELFIHLAWHPGGNALTRFQADLELMARRCEAKSIRFYSCRRGMPRLVTPSGYHSRSVEFVKEL